MKRRTVTIALAVMCTAVQGASAQSGSAPPPTDEQTYRALVRDYDRLMQRPRVSSDDARALQARFRAVHQVRLGDGKTVVTVDTSPEVQTLDRIVGPPAVPKPDQNAKNRAEALHDLVAPEASPAPTSGDPQKEAASILSRPEFRDAQPAKHEEPTWVKTFFTWLGKQVQNALNSLGKFLEWLFRGVKSNPRTPPGLVALSAFMRILLIGLLVVAAVVGVVFAVRYASREGWIGGKRRREVGAEGMSDDLAEDAALLDPLGRARSLADAGDFRGAVRLAYIASLRRLSDAGLLTLEKNRTNWEYQRHLRSRSRPAYDLLLPTTRLFDRIWYGHQTATRADFENVVAVHDQLPKSAPPLAADETAAETGNSAGGARG